MNNFKYPVLLIVIILSLSFLAYRNSLYADFVFDDEVSLGNPAIKDISLFKDMGLKGYVTSVAGGLRPFTAFTFAVNYSLGGMEPYWFHFGNLLIHLANGVLVFMFIYKTLGLTDSYKTHAGWIAFLTAIFFSIHPIQTGAVSYVSQRSEILASFFYLSALILFVNSLLSGLRIKGVLSYLGGSICVFLGLGCKEIIATLPVLVFIYWLYFLKDRTDGNKGVQKLMLALLLIPGVAGILYNIHLIKNQPGGSIGFSLGVSPLEYLLTQTRVIIKYIFLLLVPVGQNADYDFTISRGLINPPSTLFSGAVILSLIMIGVLLYKRWRPGSFGIVWYFIILSPTSSVIPIMDVIFEHRNYLPSVGFFLLFSLCLYHLFLKANVTTKQKIYAAASVLLLITFALGYLTVKRNYVWLNSRLFWEDVVHKSPNKSRGYTSLANAYKENGDFRYAEAAYLKGISLAGKTDKPYFMMALAMLYAEKGQADSAEKMVDEAFGIKPEGAPEMFYIAGFVFERSGRDAEAINHYRKALGMSPSFTVVQCQIGNLLYKKGMLEEAIMEYEAAIKSDPYYARAYNDLGIIYAKKGMFNKALINFENAYRLKPDYEEARLNLLDIRKRLAKK